MSWFTRIISFFTIITLLKRLAFGYLDPGTGSFVLQLVVAGLLSGLLAVKMFWSRLIGIFRPGVVEQDADEREQTS